MTEIEKLDAGLPFDIFDPAVNARKLHAVKMTEALNAVPVTEHEKRVQAIRNLFGSVGNNPEILPGFHCDNGSNIHAGDDFLANYNVTILDIAPVQFLPDIGAADIPVVILGFYDHIQLITINRLKFL